ncbi:MAG: hypothetical protein JSW71_12660 [Gemmatimonadota bacterium]|nr:MAG: hypothetical protein JSW71_12660 [Gemmatimonadota bacterium]
MSRAFVNEDAEGREPTYNLPKRDDPRFDEAAAWALIEGWNQGDLHGAELATGYSWGEPVLRPHVERILARAEQQSDERIAQLAERFLNRQPRS